MASIGPSLAGYSQGGQLSPEVWQQLSSLYTNPQMLQALRDMNGGGSEYIDRATGLTFAPKFKEINGSQIFDGGTVYNSQNPDQGLGHGAYSTAGSVYDANGRFAQPFQMNKTPTTFMDRFGFAIPLAAPFAVNAMLGATGAGAGAGGAGAFELPAHELTHALGELGGLGEASAGAAGLSGPLTSELPYYEATHGLGDVINLGGNELFQAGSLASGALTAPQFMQQAGSSFPGSSGPNLPGSTPGTFDWTKLIGPGLSAVGGIAGANAAKSAAEIQAQSARDAQAKLEPWYQAGGNALARLQEELGLGPNTGAANYGRSARDFGIADFQTDPGYAFRQSEQQKGLERAASAQGGIGSGKFLKDAMSYSGGLASQEYNNAFNRFQTTRTNRLNPLQSLAGQGQSTAQMVGDLSTQAGNAQAAGKVGQANALTNAIGQGYSMYQGQQQMDNNNSLMNLLLRRGV